MENEEEYIKGFEQFFDELSAGSTTGTVPEMKAQLLAFSKVRSTLATLEQKGLCVLSGYNPVRRYESALQKRKRSPDELDFVLRKEKFELQLDLKLHRTKEVYLMRQDLEKYLRVLRDGATTNKILVVWVDDDLPTLVMNLSTIQKYLSELQGERQTINSQLLEPLVDAIESTFARFMNVWIEPEEISITKEPYYDVQKLFGDSLKMKIENMKATSERRRLPDKKIAIESIVDSDIALLEQIFGEGRAEELSIEKVETKLKKMWGLGQE